jgi:hypothetical protein
MPNPIIFGNILAGVNYAFPPNALPPLFVADCQNMLPTLTGYATPRGGSSRLNTNAYGTLITSFHELILSGISYKFAAQGAVVGKFNGTDFADHITGLSSGTYGQWLNYGGYAIYANGVNKVKKTNGVTSSDLTTDLSGIAAGNCLAEWGERVWTSVGATLYGSALRAPTDFSTATTDIGFWSGTIGSTGQPITGLTPFFDILLIGKLNQLWQLSGAPETASSTFRLIPLHTRSEKDSLGFTAKGAITQVGNDLLFLDGFTIKTLSGIQAYGDVESVSIIGNVKDFLEDASGAALDKDYLQYAQFFHYKHREQVWCSIPTGASTRYWFVIDYSNQDLRKALELPKYSFFPMTGLTPICFGGVEDGSKVNLYAGCSDGFVRRMDTGYNDDGITAVDAHVTWVWGDKLRDVQPVDVVLAIRQTTGCTLTPYYAFGLQEWQEVRDASNYTAMDSEQVGSASWTANQGVYHKMLSSLGDRSGPSFVFRVRHNTASQNFEIRDSALHFRLQRRFV